jgi:hypothetical protein
MTSVIRQFRIDAAMIGTESESLALQQLLSRISYDKIIPVVETVLERYSSDQNHWHFERLMLDIGTIDFDRLENDLALKVGECLEQLLKGRMQASPASRFGDADDSDWSQNQSLAVAAEQALLFFLANGRLPWSFPLNAGQTLEAVVLSAWQQGGAAVQTREVNQLVFNEAAIELLQSPAVRRRLFTQFSGYFCEALLSRLSVEARELLEGMKGKLAELNASDKDKADFAGQLIETLFEVLVTQKMLTEDEIVWKGWNGIKTRIPGQEKSQWRAWLIKHWPSVAERISSVKARFSQVSGRDANTDQIPSFIDDRLIASSDEELNEGIFIGNAGLVLLHPFLPQLFQALGIAESETLLQPVRALVILHYLATGQTTAPEYELVLPKLLSNIPLNEPVASLQELSPDDKQEADALLAAVIRHWDALGDTSIDSLRGTFLLRQGKVSLRKDGDWLLQVESRSFDILLSQLPWGISMFHLPWMRQLCWVEWHYENE